MPKISVVVTNLNGLSAINKCLRALDRQRSDIDVETIVVGCDENASRELVTDFPRVKFIQCSGQSAIPELRATGMGRATGEIIVVTEDRCVPSENWLEEISKAHAAGYQVVGGAIEPDNVDGILGWAIYLCEYSSSMLPIPEGEVNGVPGNNASYKREALERVSEAIKKNYWEFFLHEELRKKGVRILSAPSIIVHKNVSFGFLYFLGQRFHYSRSFAGMRRKRMTGLKGLLYALIAPGIPLLMLRRIALQVIRKKRYRREFILGLPLLVVFMISYAAGEFIGYLFGQGNSLLKVE